jgi:hypothetical protein
MVRVLVDRRPTNMQVGGKGATAYCPDIVLCVDHDSGVIFAHELVHPHDSDEAVGAAVRETRAHLTQETPGVRVTWLARQEQVTTALAAYCGEDEVRLAPGESFAPWDEAYLSMDQRFGSGRALVPYLWRGDMTAEEVGALFQAAAAFYRAKPWQFLPDSQLLGMPSSTPGEPRLLISIMGKAGISRGLVLFDSEYDFERTMAEDRQADVVFASFERVDKAPPTVREEAKQHGWEIAGRSAFPEVVRMKRGGPIPCSGRDLRGVTAAFRALAEANQAYRTSTGSRRQG